MNKKTMFFIGDTAGGNYVAKALRMPPEIFLLGPIDIYHDDWCQFNKGQECNCDPDIVPRPLTNDSH